MKTLLVLLCLIFLNGASAQDQVRRVKPSKTYELDTRIPEASGLAGWNGRLIALNDSGPAQLFAIDTASGKTIQVYNLPLQIRDWEELAQDSLYFYIGDIGNNAGRRDTVEIVRVEKRSLELQRPKTETIRFAWPQTETRGKRSKTNFDCEAMTVAGDSIFLFTKEYKHGRRTRLFSLPKHPGTYEARYKSTLKTRILITGASFDEKQQKLVLCGYNLWLRPFLLVFTNVTDYNFFSGKPVKIKIRKRFRQVEGIATFDGKVYYIANERFEYSLIKSDGELHVVKLKE
ncbi:MAG TPA: T9SS C-terminal target domain-containing protein [Flavobacterium sp.]|jgi:hypothetical protein